MSGHESNPTDLLEELRMNWNLLKLLWTSRFESSSFSQPQPQCKSLAQVKRMTNYTCDQLDWELSLPAPSPILFVKFRFFTPLRPIGLLIRYQARCLQFLSDQIEKQRGKLRKFSIGHQWHASRWRDVKPNGSKWKPESRSYCSLKGWDALACFGIFSSRSDIFRSSPFRRFLPMGMEIVSSSESQFHLHLFLVALWFLLDGETATIIIRLTWSIKLGDTQRPINWTLAKNNHNFVAVSWHLTVRCHDRDFQQSRLIHSTASNSSSAQIWEWKR